MISIEATDPPSPSLRRDGAKRRLPLERHPDRLNLSTADIFGAIHTNHAITDYYRRAPFTDGLPSLNGAYAPGRRTFSGRFLRRPAGAFAPAHPDNPSGHRHWTGGFAGRRLGPVGQSGPTAFGLVATPARSTDYPVAGSAGRGIFSFDRA